MTSHRIGLGFLLLLGIAAGAIVVYAAFGMSDGVAVVTSAPVTTTPAPTSEPTATLPLCSDPAVGVGEVCLPLYLTPPLCERNELPGQPAPCRKRVEHS